MFRRPPQHHGSTPTCARSPLRLPCPCTLVPPVGGQCSPASAALPLGASTRTHPGNSPCSKLTMVHKDTSHQTHCIFLMLLTFNPGTRATFVVRWRWGGGQRRREGGGEDGGPQGSAREQTGPTEVGREVRAAGSCPCIQRCPCPPPYTPQRPLSPQALTTPTSLPHLRGAPRRPVVPFSSRFLHSRRPQTPTFPTSSS